MYINQSIVIDKYAMIANNPKIETVTIKLFNRLFIILSHKMLSHNRLVVTLKSAHIY